MASSILSACTVAVAGSFQVTQAKVRERIVANGGRVVEEIDNSTTHLIVNQDTVNKGHRKVSQAIPLPHVKLVIMRWLMESIRAGVKLDEGPYMPTPGVPTAAATRRMLRAQGKLDIEQSPPDEEQGEQYLGNKVDVPLAYPAAFEGAWRVWIGLSGLIFDATLAKVDVSNNQNKYCRLQLVESVDSEYLVYEQTGRVGDQGAYSFLGNRQLDDAIAKFEKSFKEKTGLTWFQRLEPPRKGRYVFVEQTYSQLSEAETNPVDEELEGPIFLPPSRLEVPVQDLMKLLFNEEYIEATMAEMNLDLHKLPLDTRLSRRSVELAYQCLKELGHLIATADDQRRATEGYLKDLEEATNNYYTIIPHSFGPNGRDRPPLISDEARLKGELALMQSLADAEIASKILEDAQAMSGETNLLDRKFAALNLDTIPLDHGSTEFKEITSYLFGTQGETHDTNVEVENIFRISRPGEADRFASKLQDGHSRRRLLWHGSRISNFAGILKEGLRIAPPEAPATGYMFGKGIYFADMSSKSVNYCYAEQTDDVGLLLLCEVELGPWMHEEAEANFDAQTEMNEAGELSVLGLGRTEIWLWKDAECIHPDLKGVMLPDLKESPVRTGDESRQLEYNEYVVYNVAQVRLRYVVQVDVFYRW